MPLVIEDGTGVPNADSFVSESDAVAFLAARGITTTEDKIRPLLMRGMDVFAGLSWRGARASTTQALAFPRTGVSDTDGTLYADTAIPRALIEAQVWMAHYIGNGSDPGSVSEAAIREETVGPITTKYAVATTSTTATALTVADLPNVYGRLVHLLAFDSVGDTDASDTVWFGNGRAGRA